jgi:hypothetical protein
MMTIMIKIIVTTKQKMILQEKLMVAPLVKKCTAFYELAD